MIEYSRDYDDAPIKSYFRNGRTFEVNLNGGF